MLPPYGFLPYGAQIPQLAVSFGAGSQPLLGILVMQGSALRVVWFLPCGWMLHLDVLAAQFLGPKWKNYTNQAMLFGESGFKRPSEGIRMLGASNFDTADVPRNCD